MTSSPVASEEARRVAPYVSFSALKKLLERMAAEKGPPARVDRSYLVGMSGGYQAQILAALRALGLIDPQGGPSAALHSLTSDVDGRLAPFLRDRIGEIYPEVVGLAQQNGSAGQLADTFRAVYGVQGSTLEGAIRFYLDASQFAEMPLSPHFRAPTRSRKASQKRVAPKGAKRTQGAAGSGGAPEPPTLGGMPTSTQRVELNSGGNLVLTMALDLFALSESDRSFVFDLVDRIKNYATAQGSKTGRSTPASASPSDAASQDAAEG